MRRQIFKKYQAAIPDMGGKTFVTFEAVAGDDTYTVTVRKLDRWHVWASGGGHEAQVPVNGAQVYVGDNLLAIEGNAEDMATCKLDVFVPSGIEPKSGQLVSMPAAIWPVTPGETVHFRNPGYFLHSEQTKACVGWNRAIDQTPIAFPYTNSGRLIEFLAPVYDDTDRYLEDLGGGNAGLKQAAVDDGIEYLGIPETYTSVTSTAFSPCATLKEVALPESTFTLNIANTEVNHIKHIAFGKQCTVAYPNGSGFFMKGLEGLWSQEDALCEAGSSNGSCLVRVSDGALMLSAKESTGSGEIRTMPYGKLLDGVVCNGNYSNSLELVGEYGFYNLDCRGTISVSPPSATSPNILAHAFEGTKAEIVKITSGVIGTDAIKNCRIKKLFIDCDTLETHAIWSPDGSEYPWELDVKAWRFGKKSVYQLKCKTELTVSYLDTDPPEKPCVSVIVPKQLSIKDMPVMWSNFFAKIGYKTETSGTFNVWVRLLDSPHGVEVIKTNCFGGSEEYPPGVIIVRMRECATLREIDELAFSWCRDLYDHAHGTVRGISLPNWTDRTRPGTAGNGIFNAKIVGALGSAFYVWPGPDSTNLTFGLVMGFSKEGLSDEEILMKCNQSTMQNKSSLRYLAEALFGANFQIARIFDTDNKLIWEFNA